MFLLLTTLLLAQLARRHPARLQWQLICVAPPALGMQHKENLRVTVEGANSGGLLSRFNGLSLFVPVSQLEKKGANEWWTEQVCRQNRERCKRD